MIPRRTVLRLEELGARVLPSTTVPVKATTLTTPAKITPAPIATVTGPSWLAHGRYATATTKAGAGATYTIEGSTNFPGFGFISVKGTIQSVGNVRQGQAHGRLTLSSKRGTLVLDVTGPTQSANAALPSRLTYRVVSGTGFFAHYAGHGQVQLSAILWAGYDNRGHFD